MEWDKKAVGFDQLWAEIVAMLAHVMPPLLEHRLRASRPKKVTRLVQIQALYQKLPEAAMTALQEGCPLAPAKRKEWVRQRAESLAISCLGASYIPDADAAAEYNAPGTTENRREEVREYFRAELGDRIDSYLAADLRVRGHLDVGTSTFGLLSDALKDEFFSHKEFRGIARSYRPELGKTFQSYLCHNVQEWKVKKFGKAFSAATSTVPWETIIRESVDDGHLEAGSSEVADVEENDALREDAATHGDNVETLLEVRKKMARIVQGVREGGLSPRHVALMFLYYKAYVEPDIIPAAVIKMTVGGIKRLKKDYLLAQDELLQLRLDFRGAARDWDAASSLRRRKTEELRTRFGQHGADLLKLEMIAAKSKLGELDDDVKEAEANKEELWTCQLEWIAAFIRETNARRVYEELCAKLKIYEDSKWVRSQLELVSLLKGNPPQGSIGRELSEVRAFLREFSIEVNSLPSKD